MDEFFVQGVVGGVLNRHKNRTLDKNRIATLSVEIASNLDKASQYTDVVKEANLAKDNPLSIEMWKGWDGVERPYEKEYLEHWTCEHCGDHTHEVDYDYIGNGTNHLACDLKVEDLQKKSDKIMKKVEEEMKDFDLSKSESNENSKVDMTNNEQLEIPFPED
jgi:hypothetical protein|tara:strand:+ start:167 stop:652 length:486 start_codon:yes stop_codon:yes gene_type:complete